MLGKLRDGLSQGWLNAWPGRWRRSAPTSPSCGKLRHGCANRGWLNGAPGRWRRSTPTSGQYGASNKAVRWPDVGRRVDLSRRLTSGLIVLQAAAEADSLLSRPKRNRALGVRDQGRSAAHTASDGKVFRKVAKTAELPSLYALRHTYVSHLIATNAPITYIAAQVGHSKVTTTLTYYAHLSRTATGGTSSRDGAGARGGHSCAGCARCGGRCRDPADEDDGESAAPGHQFGTRSESGAPGVSEAPDFNGGPSRTRTVDPLIKSPALHKRTGAEQHERTGTYEPAGARDLRLRAHESGCVGTNLEPEPAVQAPLLRQRGTRLASPSRRAQRASTYRDIRAYVYARYGFSPRTGWIAHVKELNGLTLRPTHNRYGAMRIDHCPPERRAAIEEVLRHFGIL